MTSLDALAADMRARAEAAKLVEAALLFYVRMAGEGIFFDDLPDPAETICDFVDIADLDDETEVPAKVLAIFEAERARAEAAEREVAALVEAVSILGAHACEPEDDEGSIAFRAALGLARDALKHARALLSPNHKTGERDA